MIDVRYLVEFPVEGSARPVIVEVEEPEELAGLERAARVDAGEVVQRAAQTFDEAVEHIRTVATSVVDGMAGLARRPDELSVEFALKFSGTVGMLVISAEAEANFKVAMKWSSSSSTPD